MIGRLRHVAAALASAGLMWSAPAQADPITAIALVAQGIAVAGGATVLGVAISVSVATYVAIGASLIGGVMARRKAARAAAAAQRAASRESLQERTLVLQSSEPSPQIIYGRCTVGGAVLDRLSSAKTYVADDGTTKTRPDALQHIVIGLACHEITNVHRVFMLGEWLEFGADKWTTHTNFRKADSAHVTKSLTFNGSGQATIPDVPAGSTVSLVSITRELWPRPETDEATQSHTGATVSGSTISSGPTSGTWQVTYSLGNTTPRVRLEWFAGTTTQTASTYLKAANSRWTDAHRLQGIAYAVLTLDLDDSRFQQGLPSDLAFDVSGKPLLDPRTGTTAYSDNTALAVYDWLRQPWGYNLTTDDINTNSVIVAANACDVLYYGTEKFSRVAGAFKAGDDKGAVLADLTENMGGFIAQGSLWSVHAGAWSAPVMSITDDDAAAPVQVPRSATDHDEAFNSARATIIPFGSTQTEDVDPYINSTFVTADGGNEWQSFTLPFCPSKSQARSLLRQFVEQARAGMIVQYTGKMRLWRLEVGDRVTLTDSIHQISNKTFRVLDWSWAPGQPVTLTLQEDVASTYDQADAMDPDPAPNTSLPPPGSVSLPAGVSVSSGNSTLMQMSDGTIVPRVLVTWTRPTGIYMTSPGARTEIEWRHVSDTAWTAQRVLGDADRAWVDGVRDQAPILVRVRHVNSFGVESAWIIRAHVVAGKSAPPTAPTALTVTEGASGERIYSVTHVQDLDHAGYIVRASGTLTHAWDQMAQVAAWTGPSTQYRSGSPGDGQWQFAVVAVDTSGNLSAPVYVTATLTQQAIGWTDVAGRPRGYRVITTGGSAVVPAPGVGLFDAATGALVAGVTATQRSYNLAKFDRTTGTLEFFKTYDIYANGWGGGINWQNAAGLTIDLNAATSDQLVVVWTYDEPQANRLHADLLAAMLRCGASAEVYGSDRIKFRGAYVLIGWGGCGAGNGYEAYRGPVDSSPDAWLDIPFTIQSGQVMVGAPGAARFGSDVYGQAGTVDIKRGAATDVFTAQTVYYNAFNVKTYDSNGNLIQIPGRPYFDYKDAPLIFDFEFDVPCGYTMIMRLSGQYEHQTYNPQNPSPGVESSGTLHLKFTRYDTPVSSTTWDEAASDVVYGSHNARAGAYSITKVLPNIAGKDGVMGSMYVRAFTTCIEGNEITLNDLVMTIEVIKV